MTLTMKKIVVSKQRGFWLRCFLGGIIGVTLYTTGAI
jgi:hypothetical protein